MFQIFPGRTSVTPVKILKLRLTLTSCVYEPYIQYPYLVFNPHNETCVRHVYHKKRHSQQWSLKPLNLHICAQGVTISRLLKTIYSATYLVKLNFDSGCIPRKSIQRSLC